MQKRSYAKRSKMKVPIQGIRSLYLFNIGQKQPNRTHCFIFAGAKETAITLLGEISHQNKEHQSRYL